MNNPPTSPQAVVNASETHLVADYDTDFISILDIFSLLPFYLSPSSAQLSMPIDSPPETDLLCLGTVLQAQIRRYKKEHRPSPAAFFSAINRSNLLVLSYQI
jgi:hypothetical protein